ncbi:MAG: hypothetical protein F6K50_30115 [Moorea sp. SIO3I7]|uniref:hypothetical protein n=1 Tax=unclassified Moorena TaxID=2683338 RepID=UPI0013C24773|nr:MULTISPECIES: hypothetical protein [unclassified Moorena]NEN99581.1 hypothetical protein [Moorena sp. SIO3I7]NEO07735.1 hypothetical protein [Moorena sp. SIO3I8]NEP26619.1 hypothetical protein [Moorena sp. SIO3I6]
MSYLTKVVFFGESDRYGGLHNYQVHRIVFPLPTSDFRLPTSDFPLLTSLFPDPKFPVP